MAEARSVGSSRRVAFVADRSRALIRLRGSIARELKARGAEVLLVAPEFTPDEAATLAAAGIDRATFDIAPKGLKGIGPVADWTLTREIGAVLAGWRPEVVVCYGARTMIHAALAARRAGAREIVVAVTGLSQKAAEASAEGRLLSARRYAKAFKAATAAIAHNRDDARALARSGLLRAGLDVTVVAGSGVDLGQFEVQPLPPIAAGLVFLMVAPLDRTRGVIDYCEAARRVKERAPEATFLLAGPAGEGPGGFDPADLRAYEDAIEFLGPLADIRPALGRAHVFVYPSHGEGMPRVVLEAMAAGRPILTTDAPGCRETVDDRVNGCLVPVADVGKLAEAMTSFLKRPDLLPSMARASRHKAERRFDERDVNRTLLAVLGFAS
ncbi:MAG: glycosyltransferase [Pseudomonadota bacterium]